MNMKQIFPTLLTALALSGFLASSQATLAQDATTAATGSFGC